MFHDEHWKFGYMDENGKVVIPAKFNSASDFSEGMAAVSPSPLEAHTVLLIKPARRYLLILTMFLNSSTELQ